MASGRRRRAVRARASFWPLSPRMEGGAGQPSDIPSLAREVSRQQEEEAGGDSGER